MFENDESRDWEIPEEEIPPGLEKKWQDRETGLNKTVVCRSCGHEVPGETLLCLFCGESTGVRAGLFSRIRGWFSDSLPGLFLFVVILAGVLLWLLH